MEETWTILKVIQWTAGYFMRKGIDQPRANAEVLLAHVLEMERLQLYLHYDKPLTPEELARYREAVRRRASREPTQYITRKQEFWSLDFEVNPSVLIPRPETELLVERALEILSTRPGPVLDLGTGSGAIAVALAHEKSSLEVFATDRAWAALQVAKRNAIRHHVADRIAFVAMDLFGAFHPALPPFELIVTNPPYVGEREFLSLAPEVARHEPSPALRGGGFEGLKTIRRILRESTTYLRAGGFLIMEIGHGQAELLEKEVCENRCFQEVQFVKDYSGVLRILQAKKIERSIDG